MHYAASDVVLEVHISGSSRFVTILEDGWCVWSTDDGKLPIHLPSLVQVMVKSGQDANAARWTQAEPSWVVASWDFSFYIVSSFNFLTILTLSVHALLFWCFHNPQNSDVDY